MTVDETGRGAAGSVGTAVHCFSVLLNKVRRSCSGPCSTTEFYLCCLPGHFHKNASDAPLSVVYS